MTLATILFILAAFVSVVRPGHGRSNRLPEFFWPVRIYYEDTDAGGVVYHARYLHLLERARTEWLRSLGVEQDRLLAETSLLFLVSHLVVDYLRPARFNQQLQVTVVPLSIRGIRMRLQQEVRDLDGVIHCRAEVTVVCARAPELKPVRLPRFLIEELPDGLREP